MYNTNLNHAAIKQIDGIDCIDIDNLPIKYVNHKFKSRNVNWSKLLILVDISHASKKYATLVIEKHFTCYLLRDSTDSIINQRTAKECLLTKVFSDSIADVFNISNKRPIIHSKASLLPLQTRNHSRHHSWINANLVDYSISGRQSNSVFIYTPDDTIYIKVSERPSYLKKKFAEVQQMQLALLGMLSSLNICCREISQSVSNNPNDNPACRYGIPKEKLQQFILTFAKKFYLTNQENKKD